jgi:uncharacterized protein (TIGR02266 family)
MNTVALVVPVRFSGSGLTMQTTTSQLGLKSAFVRTVVAPKEGAQVQLAILAPGLAQPLEVTGTVGERVLPGTKGKECGFWVSFAVQGFAEKQLVAVLEKLGGVRPKPQTAPGPTRPAAAPPMRQDTRVPAQLRVEWPSTREFLVAYSENISRGGLFIATDNPPALREVIELSLQLPDGKPPVKTKAEVVQRLGKAEAAQFGRKQGIGVQFIGADDEFRRRLDDCMEHLLAT